MRDVLRHSVNMFYTCCWVHAARRRLVAPKGIVVQVAISGLHECQRHENSHVIAFVDSVNDTTRPRKVSPRLRQRRMFVCIREEELCCTCAVKHTGQGGKHEVVTPPVPRTVPESGLLIVIFTQRGLRHFLDPWRPEY